jgi:hypothetical protein
LCTRRANARRVVVFVPLLAVFGEELA